MKITFDKNIKAGIAIFATLLVSAGAYQFYRVGYSGSEAGIKNDPSGEQKPSAYCSHTLLNACNVAKNEYNDATRKYCNDLPRAERRACREAFGRDFRDRYSQSFRDQCSDFCGITLPF